MDLSKLKQDAEKSLDKRLGTYAYIRKQDCYTNYVDGYIDGAEPREKRIKELEKQVKEWKALQEMFDGKSFKLEGEITNLHKQILKLEKENAELKQACDETQELLDKQIEATLKLDKENAELKAKNKWYSEQVCNKECAEVWGQVEKLQKENAELDCQKNRNKFCYSCANATEKCFKNEIGCPCDKYKSYKEEIKKWKDEWQEQVQKATDEGYARTLQTIQLSKAKEIIKELMSFSVQLCDCRHTVDFEKTREEAEQFISEVEK